MISKTSSVIENFIREQVKIKKTNENLNKTNEQNSPLIVGISGPQGSGKSKNAAETCEILNNPYNKNVEPLKTVVLSLDDIYLTHQDQLEFSSAHSNNKLLSHRGLPGTHEISLGIKTLKALKQLSFESNTENKNKNNNPVFLPFYDKSMYNGQGDRISESLWKKVSSPVDVIIFEGWMTGFTSIGKSNIETIYSSFSNHKNTQDRALNTFLSTDINSLIEIDSYLKNYLPLWSLIDCLVHLHPSNLNYTYTWRLHQEHKLIEIKKQGMSDEQVIQFVNGYIPIYYLYSKSLSEKHLKKPYLELVLDSHWEIIKTKSS